MASPREPRLCSASGVERTAAILVIGNEILTGKVEETNARWLSEQLFELGVSLKRILVIPDEIEVISESVRALRPTVNHLFTSGGIGPTHDDQTIPGIARALGRPVVRIAPLEQLLRHYYGERCNDDVLRMADAPEGFELIDAADRNWPVLAVENVVILPGVPEIFRKKFHSIRERFRSEPFALEVLYTTLEEPLLAAHLNRVTASFPAVSVGSYPKFTDPRYKVKVTIESKDAGLVADAMRLLKTLVPADTVVAAPE